MALFERLKSDASKAWQAYTEHDFIKQMGQGTLPKAAFQRYLIQDYLFLIQFARAHALAVYKAPDLATMREVLEGLKAILDVEMQLHVKLCGEWGLSPEMLQAEPEATETIAYTRFVLEAGQAGDLLDLFTALAPCMIGYAEIGKTLDSAAAADNPYRVWINEYAGDEYQEIAEATKQLLDRLADTSLTQVRYPRLLKLFEQATWLEADFWQMGLDTAD